MYSSAAVEILGRGFVVWEPYLNGAMILRNIIQLTGLTGSLTKESTPDRAGVAATNLPSSLIAIARQAVVLLATCNGGLFASTISNDLIHSRNISERVVCLKLLGLFISKVYSNNLETVDYIFSFTGNCRGYRQDIRSKHTAFKR